MGASSLSELVAGSTERIALSCSLFPTSCSLRPTRYSLFDIQAGWRSARRTDTSFETPGSSIVTPKSESATAIVCLLCVTTMNWASSASSRRTAVNRPIFSSSNGASISSSTQKGVGLIRKLAKMSAIAVKVFSPPESMAIFLSRFPGGWATMSTPGSSLEPLADFLHPVPESEREVVRLSGLPDCLCVLIRRFRRESRRHGKLVGPCQSALQGRQLGLDFSPTDLHGGACLPIQRQRVPNRRQVPLHPPRRVSIVPVRLLSRDQVRPDVGGTACQFLTETLASLPFGLAATGRSSDRVDLLTEEAGSGRPPRP